LIKVTQHEEEFFNRITTQEQKQLDNLHLQVKELCTKLQKTTNKEQISQITEELYEVTRRIESWASYLLTLTHRVRGQVHIKLTKVNIIDLINEVIEECENLFDQEVQFINQHNLKYHDITCDREKMKAVIKSLLIHAINNNNINNNNSSNNNNNTVSISLEDDLLDFELNISATTKSKKSIEAIRLTIKVQGNKLTEQQLKLIFTPTFRQNDELTFIECSNVIDAHYGNFKVNNDHNNNQDKGINYSITIPANIKDIRPKVMDLPDIRIENLQKIAEIFLQEQKDDILNIAQTLLQAGSELGEYYQALIARGKKPIVAITALMRKIIVIANARFKDYYLKPAKT
jgi:hypothetical protein